MKRRLITGVYLSLAALAACQAEPDGSTDMVSQAESASCGAEMPPTPYWDGSRLPATEAGQIYLLYADLEKPGEFVMARVDYKKGEVVSAVRTKSTTVGSLLSKLDQAAQWAGGRQPTPPQPVQPWSLVSALVEWGQVASGDLLDAGLGGVCPGK